MKRPSTKAAPKRSGKLGVTTTKPLPAAVSSNPAVDTFLDELDHPLKRELVEVRAIILGVSPEICDGIKWNAPSFRTTEWFATVNLRSRDQVQLIFHLGAKVKALPSGGLKIADPAGLIKWLGKDRCLVTLGTGKEIKDRRAALAALVREWNRYL